jgi:hypothetical protein
MAPITRQREDCALSDEVCRGVVLVQLRKEDEVRVLGEKGHLTFRIATISTVCVSFDELSDRKVTRGLSGEMVMCLLMTQFESANLTEPAPCRPGEGWSRTMASGQ